MLNAADQNEEVTGFVHSFSDDRISSCFVSFSKVFVTGFSITCPVCFFDGSLRPIYRGQLGIDGDEDGQMIDGQ